VNRVVEHGGKVEIENTIVLVNRIANEIEVTRDNPGARKQGPEGFKFCKKQGGIRVIGGSVNVGDNKEKSEVVETRPTEREKQSRRVETSEKSQGSQAVRMPPELPAKSSVTKAERFGGSREAATKRSNKHSFIFCKQMMSL
jgi:hypothetical protein